VLKISAPLSFFGGEHFARFIKRGSHFSISWLSVGEFQFAVPVKKQLGASRNIFKSGPICRAMPRCRRSFKIGFRSICQLVCS
jgi:hypothetical protein